MPTQTMPTQAIVNGRLVMADRVIEQGAVVFRDGVITDCGAADSVRLPADAIITDAGNHFVGPGFIDIHCHGGGGYFIHEHPVKAVYPHLKQGTTGMLATIAYNYSKTAVLQGIRQVLQATEEEKYGAVFAGIHLEGPYINPKYGAGTQNVRGVDPEEYRHLLQVAGQAIKVWTFAPELPGAREFATAVAVSGRDIVLSVGHSEVDPQTLYSYIPLGLKLACHCMNATGGQSPRYRGTREAGLDEAVLVCDDITAEVIPDAHGAHVRPMMLKLIHRAKGTDRVIVITDGFVDAGKYDLFCSDAMDINFDEAGDICGSNLTMNHAVKNMMKHTGVGIVEAFRMACLNPAMLLNMDHEVGSLAKGKKANIVIVKENMEVRSVFFQGEQVD